MFQKWIRLFIILGILFYYFPVMSLQYCPLASHEGNHHEGNHRGGSHHEGNHKDGGQFNCGYVFHCPFTFNSSFSEPFVILSAEKLVSVSSSINFGDFRFPIFHPPKESLRNISPMNQNKGMNGNLALGLLDNC